MLTKKINNTLAVLKKKVFYLNQKYLSKYLIVLLVASEILLSHYTYLVFRNMVLLFFSWNICMSVLEKQNSSPVHQRTKYSIKRKTHFSAKQFDRFWFSNQYIWQFFQITVLYWLNVWRTAHFTWAVLVVFPVAEDLKIVVVGFGYRNIQDGISREQRTGTTS